MIYLLNKKVSELKPTLMKKIFLSLLVFGIANYSFSQTTGTFKDPQDGYVYKTVTIGSQTWMAENLRTTKYNDGTEIPNVAVNKKWESLSTGAYCYCWNREKTAAKFGLLYNWYAVNTGKLAPSGWHVPTYAEWATLEKYLIANGYNYDGSTNGNKIAKSLAATSEWQQNIHKGIIGNDRNENNRSGFTALPAGFRKSDGLFSSIKAAGLTWVGNEGSWWSSSEFSGDNASHWLLVYNGTGLGYFKASKRFGFSVRCVRDSVN